MTTALFDTDVWQVYDIRQRRLQYTAVFLTPRYTVHRWTGGRRRRNNGGNIRQRALQAETMRRRVTAGRDGNSVTNIAA